MTTHPLGSGPKQSSQVGLSSTIMAYTPSLLPLIPCHYCLPQIQICRSDNRPPLFVDQVIGFQANHLSGTTAACGWP
jgi:hypothetical protein